MGSPFSPRGRQRKWTVQHWLWFVCGLWAQRCAGLITSPTRGVLSVKHFSGHEISHAECWWRAAPRLLPSMCNSGLQVILGMLWQLQCRESEKVDCPSPNKSWRLLSFPCLFAKSHPNPHPIPLENLPCSLTAQYRWPMPVFSFPDQPASHPRYLGFACNSYLGWKNPLLIAIFCTFFPHPSPTAEFRRTLG